MPINVIDILKPANNGQFPAYEDTDGYGGFQVRANYSDITDIPMANRKIGMLAYSVSDGYFWQLNGTVDNGGWQQAKFNANSILGKSISSNAVQPGQTLTWSDDSGLWEPSFINQTKKLNIDPSLVNYMSVGTDVFARWSLNSLSSIVSSGSANPISLSKFGNVTLGNNNWYYGNSLTFTDGYLKSQATNVVPNSSNISISFWVKIDDLSKSPNQEIFSIKYGAPLTDLINIKRTGTDGSWSITAGPVSNPTINNKIKQGNWNLVSVNIQTDTMMGFVALSASINGIDAGLTSYSASGTFPNNTTQNNYYYFGYSGSNDSTMSLAELRIIDGPTSIDWLDFYTKTVNRLYVNGNSFINGNATVSGSMKIAGSTPNVNTIEKNSIYGLTVPKAFAAFIYSTAPNANLTDSNGVVRTNTYLSNSFNISSAKYVSSSPSYFEFTYVNATSNMILVTGVDYHASKTKYIAKYLWINDSTIRIYFIDSNTGSLLDPADAPYAHFLVFGLQ